MQLMPFFPFDTHNLLSGAIVVFGLQLAAFVFAAALRTDRLTDLTYGLTFVVVAALLWVGRATPPFHTLWWVLAAVVIWGVRLAAYLFVRILKMGHDPRFDGRREDPWAFARFWLFQGIAVWIILLPMLLAAARWDSSPPGPLAIVGLMLWLFGFAWESVADWQKYRFRTNPANAGRWIESGVWKYSRFPNYFGEIALWWGLWLACLPLLGWLALPAALGPLFLSFILLRVSGIPLLEEQSRKRYGNQDGFQAYVARTNRLVPWFPRSS